MVCNWNIIPKELFDEDILYMMEYFLQVYRYYAEGFYDLIAIVAGIVQTVLYCDFFYLYVTKGKWIISDIPRSIFLFSAYIVMLGNHV